MFELDFLNFRDIVNILLSFLLGGFTVVKICKKLQEEEENKKDTGAE